MRRSDCVPLAGLAGPCPRCGALMDPAHTTVEPLGLSCAACCPEHGAAEHLPERAVETLTGEQIPLIGGD